MNTDQTMNGKQTMYKALTAAVLVMYAAPLCFSAQSISVKVDIIIASNTEPAKIDPAIKDIQKDLSSFSFSTYRLLQRRSLNTRQNVPSVLTLPEGKIMELTYLHSEGDYVSCKIRIAGDGFDYLNTVCRIRQGSRFIAGGPQTSTGVIILAITPK